MEFLIASLVFFFVGGTVALLLKNNPRMATGSGLLGVIFGSISGFIPAAGATVPVDLYVPGCPPHPVTILDGILRLLGKL